MRARHLLFIFVIQATQGQASSPGSDREAFSHFQAKFGKKYSTRSELEYRFRIFSQNLGLVGEAKRHGGKVLLGASAKSYESEVNDFADLSKEEFKKFYLLPKSFFDRKRRLQSAVSEGAQGFSSLSSLPRKVDWASRGAVSTPANQSRCNSCYAFAAVFAVEAHHRIKFGSEIALSPQEILDCSEEDEGCLGGQPTSSLEYIRAHGISFLQDYPYEAKRNTQCLGGPKPRNLKPQRRLQQIQIFSPGYASGDTVTPVYFNSPPPLSPRPYNPFRNQQKPFGNYSPYLPFQNPKSQTAFLKNPFNPFARIFKKITNSPPKQPTPQPSNPKPSPTLKPPNFPSPPFPPYTPPQTPPPSPPVLTNSHGKPKYARVKGVRTLQPGLLHLLSGLTSGPVVIALRVSDQFKFYKNGIFSGDGCETSDTPNHAALAVGYDLSDPIPYIHVKNSWGTQWGDNGFIKMAIGPLSPEAKGLCNIAGSGFNVTPELL